MDKCVKPWVCASEENYESFIKGRGGLGLAVYGCRWVGLKNIYIYI